MEGDDLLSLVEEMNATGKFQDRLLILENLMLLLNAKIPMIYVDYLSLGVDWRTPLSKD